jgi:hypothetical protein
MEEATGWSSRNAASVSQGRACAEDSSHHPIAEGEPVRDLAYGPPLLVEPDGIALDALLSLVDLCAAENRLCL